MEKRGGKLPGRYVRWLSSQFGQRGFGFGELVLGLLDEMRGGLGDVGFVGQASFEGADLLCELIAAFGGSLFLSVNVNEVFEEDSTAGSLGAGGIGWGE